MARWLCSALAALFAAVAPAADGAPHLLKREFTNADGSKSPYVLFVPAAYDGKTPAPIILSLHGSGETKGARSSRGEKDPTVKAEKSREMVAALKVAGGSPKYTELLGVDHYSWDPAYDTEELYT